MKLLEWIQQSDAVTAAILILVPNIAAAITLTAIMKTAKNYDQFSHRVPLVTVVFLLVANLIGITLIASLNPNRRFYFFEQSSGGVWAFEVLPTSILFAFFSIALYRRKIAR